MRPLPLLAAALTLAIAPIAHADTYTYTFYGQDPVDVELGIFNPYSDIFTVDTSMRFSHPGDNQIVAACYPPDCFSTPNLPDGGTSRDFIRNDGIVDYYGGPLGDEEVLYLASNSTFTGPSLSPFSGSVDNPVILTGTFYAGVYLPFEDYEPRGIVTIVDNTLAASAVPEPSTLALLGTGALGLVTTFRRRLRA